jgi:hypothetical protein
VKRAGCDELAGADLIDAIVEELGGGSYKVHQGDEPIADLVQHLVAKGEVWTPNPSGVPPRPPRTTCLIGVKSPDTVRTFEIGLFWADYSMEQLESGGKGRGPYKPVAPHLYVQHVPDQGYLGAVLPCELRRTGTGRQSGPLPLGVSVEIGGNSAVDPELVGTVVARVARQMATHIPCLNRPSIPDSVL